MPRALVDLHVYSAGPVQRDGHRHAADAPAHDTHTRRGGRVDESLTDELELELHLIVVVVGRLLWR